MHLVVLHGVFEDGGDLLTSGFTSRSKLGDTMLRQSTFNQSRDIRRVITESTQTVRDTQILEETSELFSENFTSHGLLDLGGISTKSSGSINVTIRTSVSSETEDGRSSQSNRDTMGLQIKCF